MSLKIDRYCNLRHFNLMKINTSHITIITTTTTLIRMAVAG
ncbi:MAG TPA: thr operon leader peptide [Colwellia sp.]|nr:thr operon leader peptide [Colwellia sp.]